MIRSDRHKYTKAVKLAVALSLAALAGGGSITWGLGEQAEYVRQAEHYRTKKASDTANQIRDSCLRAIVLDKVSCASKARQEQRSNERDEQDLVAQKTSALWTMVTAWVAIVGTMFSAVGIFLVWTTFRETRRANEINREAMIASNRAWLKMNVKTDRAWSIHIMGGKVQLAIQIGIENVGHTVARDIRAIGSLWLPEDRNGKFESVPDGFHIGMSNTPTYLFPNEREDLRVSGMLFDLDDAYRSTTWATLQEQDLPLLFAVTVSYRLVYEDEGFPRRMTEQVFAVYRNGEGMEMLQRGEWQSMYVKLVLATGNPRVT